ncbi:OLC1v1015335C1 [Oldenlandia corymbosa var. corymbosa]|uniref:OLC1v1015335C1 n=1 Tax=Oldenlandia corymbosa var. corymbosa TaxID=529605 RepID=A0AAV1E387_OLDCO|nr:OLC1v1015335C1 [Oldenlandia corymbosa var. corymbosa]
MSEPSAPNSAGLGTRKGKAKTSSPASDLGSGKPVIVMICGSLVYYHCAYRNSSLVSLVSDVFIVLLCSLAILGLLFRQMNIQVPVDPLEWQISQDAANSMFACLANTIGAAESVLRVAATGHDKRLFFKVVSILYLLSAFARIVSAATFAYVAIELVVPLAKRFLEFGSGIVSITYTSPSYFGLDLSSLLVASLG